MGPKSALCDFLGAKCFELALSKSGLWSLDGLCSRGCPADCEGLTVSVIENSTPMNPLTICGLASTSEVASFARSWVDNVDCHEWVTKYLSVVTVEYAGKTIPTWYTDVAMTNTRWLSVIGIANYNELLHKLSF